MGVDQLVTGGDFDDPVVDSLTSDSVNTEDSRITRNVDDIGTDSFKVISDFYAKNGFSTFTASGGDTPLASRGLILRCASQTDSEAGIRDIKKYLASSLLSYDNDWRYRVILNIEDVSQQVAAGIGNADIGADGPLFEVDNGTLYGSANGSRTSIQSVSNGATLDLYFEYEAGSEIRFYVDDPPPSDPDLTVTSNLPTGSVSDRFYGVRAKSPDGIAYDTDIMRMEVAILP